MHVGCSTLQKIVMFVLLVVLLFPFCVAILW